MTVVVRPAPPRLPGSSLVPVRPPWSNNIRPFPVRPWSPPVPEPLPPAPLIDVSPRGLLVLLLSQIWGALGNSRVEWRTPQENIYSENGIYHLTFRSSAQRVGKSCYTDAPVSISGENVWSTDVGLPNNKVTSLSVSCTGSDTKAVCHSVDSPKKPMLRMRYTVENSPGIQEVNMELAGDIEQWDIDGNVSRNVSLIASSVDGKSLRVEYPVPPYVRPQVDPQRQAKPGRAPKLVPLPRPAVPAPAPAEPDREPAPTPVPVEPGPAPAPVPDVPVRKPQAPPVPANPEPVIDGELGPPLPVPVPVTRPDDHFPIPDGPRLSAMAHDRHRRRSERS